MKNYSIYLFTVLSFLAFSNSWGQYSGTGIFQKITSETELTDGYYVITNVDEEFAMNNQHTGSLFPKTDVTLVSGELVNPSAQIVWRIETDGGGRTIYSEDGEIYASYTGSTNNIQAVSAVTEDNQRWTFTYSTDEFVVTNLAVPGRTLRYNSGAPRFVCYGTTFGQNMRLFKLDEGSASSPILDADPFSLSDLNYEIDNGPSAEQSISISGANLDGSDVTVSVPVSSDFELAETASGTYSNSITLASFDGTATDIFVRLKSGLAVDSYTDDVTISGGDASDITVSLEGEVTPETITYDNVENFNNSNATASYSDNSFVGENGITWSYIESRNANNDANGSGIDLPALMLRESSSDSKVTSSTISGGISDFSVKLYKGFTGGGDRQVELFVNGASQGTSTIFDNYDEQIFTVEDINIAGDIIIELRNTTSKQIIVDDISWNSFAIVPDYTYESGAWSPSDPVGSSTATDNILIADGSVDITSTLVANNLEVASGATLNVTSSGVLDLAGDITNNGDLVFQSDASGAGQLANFSGSITGDITTERFIPKRSDNARAFRFLASPVGNVNIADAWQQQTHITGTGGASNGFDATSTDNPSMFTYDHTLSDQINNNAWVPIASTTQDIQAGQPYRLYVRGDRSVSLSDNDAATNDVTLSATGTLHTGNFSVTTSNFSENYSFVGNPYQAVVDLNNLTYGADVNTNSAYYWDPSLGTAGGFVSISLSSGTPDPSSSNADEFLRPGQAVFIRNNNTGSDYSIEFNEDDKVTSGSQTEVFSTEEIPAFVNVRLYKTDKLNNNGTEEDALGLRFSEEGNNEIDELDASKMGNPGINLATVNANQLFSIENRALPQTGENIPFLLNNLSTDSYTFTFNVQNFNSDDELFLKDNYTEELIPIQHAHSEIEFTADASIQESINILRFELIFGNVTLSDNEFTFAEQVQVYPNPVKDMINISIANTLAKKNVQIEIYDVVGKQISQTKVNFEENSNYKLNASDLNSGMYFIKINLGSKNHVKKFIKL